MAISVQNGTAQLSMYTQICNAAHAVIEAALDKMGESFEKDDHAGWAQATRDFDRGLALYHVADEMLEAQQ